MATLVYSDVNGVDRSFSLGADPIMVGRAPECAIRSDDPRVSRVHARFYFDQGSVWIEDLGSANGVYVGPTKIQRAAVPIGEIVLVGSIMIRLMPSSGTLPPPMGLHGTLAQWLEMERKARSAVEDERDAFVKRVGEMFEEVRTLREARGAHETDAGGAREELERLRRSSAAELEAMRADVMKAREAKMIAETHAGISAAETLAESDMIISSLRNQLAELRTSAGDTQVQFVSDELAEVTARAEKAEQDLATAQIRGQGAERNLTAANAIITELEAQVRRAGSAESGADKRIAEALARADESDKRASAADTMAKAMAKDVAEALRRAAEAEARARGVARELDGAYRRADTAEQRDGERAAATREAEARAAAAEGKLAESQREVTAVAERIEKALNAKLDQVQRELAAERSTALALVDRKTQVERELSELRASYAGARERVQVAEAKASGYDARVETLEERIQDLESGIAVEQTASQSTLEEATARVAKLEEQLAEARRRISEAEVREQDAEIRVATADARSTEVDVRAREIEARAKEAAERMVDAERRARDTIAELRETKGELTQITLERDRMSAQLRDLHDGEATSRTSVGEATSRTSVGEATSRTSVGEATSRTSVGEPDATSELSRYTALVARAAELEQKLSEMGRHDENLRRQLADAEARVAAQLRAQEDEPTDMGKVLPIEFAEYLSALEESIDSLRSNMRAASDETAMMEPSDSVTAVASAVSQAAEHVERARDALKTLSAMVATT